MEMSGQFHALATLAAGNIPGAHGIAGWVGPRAGLLPWMRVGPLYRLSY